MRRAGRGRHLQALEPGQIRTTCPYCGVGCGVLAKADGKGGQTIEIPVTMASIPMFIREGDEEDTGFMVLVLDGEVTVENIVVSRVSPITLTVLGPGSMHGELGLIDGLPRSASCTASSDLRCAILTREGMLQLLKDDPRIGAKLMMAISMRIGDRLRDNTEKLKKYVQLTKTMQQEIDRLMPS